MKHIEIIVDLQLCLQRSSVTRLTYEVARAHARETMVLAQDSVHIFYGRLDLLGKERWQYEALKEEDDSSDAQSDPLSGGVPIITNMQLQEPPPRWLVSGWFDV